MQPIKFGTDGWRATIADQFTFANVDLVARAIAAYIRECGGEEQGVVVGYDNRFLSEQFAAVVTSALRKAGIRILLLSSPAPTPVAAFAVRHYHAAGAVMLTASHNPAHYHGIKFIPHYAGPAMPAEIDGICRQLQKLSEGGRAAEKRIKQSGGEPVEVIDPREAYLQHLSELIDVKAFAARPLKIVVDPMYGAGIGYLDYLGRLGCRVEAIHNYRDPLFGNILPDPVDANLGELQARVRQTQADLGLALDGDADRLGVIDAQGRYWTANQIFTLLMEHLVKSRGWFGQVARTVATTHMIDALAARYGLKVVETPVGFKYIGQCLRQGAFIGGEESGGLSIRGHVPEKDGILAGLLVAEMIACWEKQPLELAAEIERLVGSLHSRRLDLAIDAPQKDELLRRLSDWAPDRLNGLQVTEVRHTDGVKVVLEDGSWALIRPSGTEALFRIYTEAPSARAREALEETVCRLTGLTEQPQTTV